MPKQYFFVLDRFPIIFQEQNPTNLFSVDLLKVLEDLKIQIDIVDVFRPSKETPGIAQQAKEIGSKVLWLQYGIHSDEAKAIAESSNMEFISNRCIKQEYQKIFQKSNPVFPALKN